MLIQWLLNHPVCAPEEVSYLQIEEKKFHDMLVEANREATEVSSNMSSAHQGMIWNNVADMRLIHCLIVDSVKECYYYEMKY